MEYVTWSLSDFDAHLVIGNRLPVCRHVPLLLEVSVENVGDVSKPERAHGRPANRVDRRAERGVDQVIEVVIVAVVAVTGIRAVSRKFRSLVQCLAFYFDAVLWYNKLVLEL